MNFRFFGSISGAHGTLLSFKVGHQVGVKAQPGWVAPKQKKTGLPDHQGRMAKNVCAEHTVQSRDNPEKQRFRDPGTRAPPPNALRREWRRSQSIQPTGPCIRGVGPDITRQPRIAQHLMFRAGLSVGKSRRHVSAALGSRPDSLDGKTSRRPLVNMDRQSSLQGSCVTLRRRRERTPVVAAPEAPLVLRGLRQWATGR